MGEETSPSDPLTRIYREDFESLHGVLCRLKRNRLSPEEAQEALQNAFLALSERHRRDGFWPDDVRAWLVRVAVIQARRRTRRPAVSLDQPAGKQDSFMGALSAAFADPLVKSPSSILTQEETLSLMKGALEELSEEVRVVVESHIVDGKTFAEIARERDLSEENAKKICQRGLSQIHETLGRHSSTMVPEANANTYRPRTRKGALEAIDTLPKEYARILEHRYVSNLPLEQCAVLESLSRETAQTRLDRGEELLERKYGLSPLDLVALLRKAN
jgi:RNA polymerase sigma factor (sigma-70 family)